MARPRNFDENQALDRAMLVFWQRGYAGTSIADLVEATGLGRQSLYNTFGDKQSLFARALQRYADKTASMTEPLRRPDAGIATIRAFILSALRFQKGANCGVCMVVKTAFDHQVPDPAIRQVVQQAARASRKLYARVLERAQLRGEVDPTRDPEQLANYLFTVHNGLSPLGQSGASQAELEQALDLALSAVLPAPGARATEPGGSAPHLARQ